MLSVELLEERNLLSAVPTGDDFLLPSGAARGFAADGSFVVVNYASTVSGWDIIAQHYSPAGVPDEDPATVIAVQDYPSHADVTVDASGGYVVSWEVWTGGNDYEVFCAAHGRGWHSP